MKLLITGGEGLLGGALGLEARNRGWSVWARGRRDLDVTDQAAIRHTLERLRPNWIAHCAAYTAVDRAESEPGAAFALNRDATELLAREAAHVGAAVLYPSTDFVFDGYSSTPYRPTDPTGPLSVYGKSKLAGEQALRALGTRSLIARTGWLYGAGGRNFVDSMLHKLESGAPVRVVTDQVGGPTWTHSLAAALIDLIGQGETGLLHVSDRGRASWHELASAAAGLAGLEAAAVEPVSSDEWDAPAPRPAWSVLDVSDTERRLGRAMPEWRLSLERYLAHRGAAL